MRTKFHWEVPVQANTGQTGVQHVEAYWSPSQTSTIQAVKDAARIEARAATGGQREFAVVGEPVLLDGPPEPVAA